MADTPYVKTVTYARRLYFMAESGTDFPTDATLRVSLAS